jgi:hypothetical protein
MKKYPRTYHFPFSPGTTSDDRINKDYSSLIGVPIVITEKLDGENNAIVRNGVYGRSHAEFSRNPWTVKTKELHAQIGYLLLNDEYVFGENMYAEHSLIYNNLTSPFYMFGMRIGETWCSYSDLRVFSEILEIPRVPTLFSGICKTEKELQELIEKLVKEPSTLGCEQKEGVVVRLEREFSDREFSTSVMKWVRKGHVQTDEHWSRNWKKANIKY